MNNSRAPRAALWCGIDEGNYERHQELSKTSYGFPRLDSKFEKIYETKQM